MSNYTHYAQLGNSCQTSADMLVSNTKFFPLAEERYTWPFTRMARYPGQYEGCDYYPDKEKKEKQEKGDKAYIPYVKTSCCGH